MANCEECYHYEACEYGRVVGAKNAELCQIFKDRSRIVELPCGYGKKVWAVGDKKIVECEIDEISFGVVGLMYLVNFECDSDCDGCPFNSWHQDYSGEYSCDGEYGQASIHGSQFGENVFLTREEAETFLKEAEAALAMLKEGEECIST